MKNAPTLNNSKPAPERKTSEPSAPAVSRVTRRAPGGQGQGRRHLHPPGAGPRRDIQAQGDPGHRSRRAR